MRRPSPLTQVVRWMLIALALVWSAIPILLVVLSSFKEASQIFEVSPSFIFRPTLENASSLKSHLVLGGCGLMVASAELWRCLSRAVSAGLVGQSAAICVSAYALTITATDFEVVAKADLGYLLLLGSKPS